jgi:hypothetical protein
MSFQWTFTLTEASSGHAIEDATVWVTKDATGLVLLAAAKTNSLGVATFTFSAAGDAGTDYVWGWKEGYDFKNPATKTVSAGGSGTGTAAASGAQIPVGYTVLEAVTRAFRAIDIVSLGETIETNIRDDGLRILNDMLDTWSTERLMVWAVKRVLYTLTGAQVITIGPGCDINVPRPPRIERFGLVLLDNPSLPLELPMESLTFDGWACIVNKDITSSVPRAAYYDLSFPIGKIYLWPTPTTAHQLAVYLWQELLGFNDTANDIVLPPGYARAIHYNLICEIAANYGKEPSPTIQRLALESKAQIARINAPRSEMTVDEALLRVGRRHGWNWRTGNYYR